MGEIDKGMSTFRDSVAVSITQRKKDIQSLQQATKAIRADARKFISECGDTRSARAQDFRNRLQEKRKELAANVVALRQELCRKRQALHADLVSARRAWRQIGPGAGNRKEAIP